MEQMSPQEQAEDELHRLGRALAEHAGEVLERVTTRTAGREQVLAASVRASLAQICMLATVTVARWIAGDPPESGLKAGREAWELFGALAAHRAAPLHEVTRRCLCWRDSVHEVLAEQAEIHGTPPSVLAKARSMTQTTLDVTLVRVGEAFEAGRARTEAELASRQEELAFLATHDPLGPAQPHLIVDRGEQMLARPPPPIAGGRAVINVDNFTAINDTLGHSLGDELLRAIAARLDGVVRDTDALGRIGGDEFVVLAEEVSMAAGADVIADRLREALRAPSGSER